MKAQIDAPLLWTYPLKPYTFLMLLPLKVVLQI